MALYVAICLLAALTALPESAAHAGVTPIIWGVTVGLAVAHWFAFRLSARRVGAGRLRPHDVKSAGAQLSGAVGVALALVGYVVARESDAARARSLLYATAALVVAVVIAELKNRLAGP